jgi:hypothetical protein
MAVGRGGGIVTFIPERDLAFHPRTLAEWQEYVDERIVIGTVERGMTEVEATRCALIMAGPRPGDREQLTLTGKPAQQPTRSKRR